MNVDARPMLRKTSTNSSFHRSASTSSTLTDVISDELFPKFATVDEDWDDFGYLLESDKNSPKKKVSFGPVENLVANKGSDGTFTA